MYQNGYKSRAADKKFSSIILCSCEGCPDHWPANRRSGSVYAFEQPTFMVYLMAWATLCWAGAFLLRKSMKEELPQVLRFLLPVSREREDKLGLHILKKNQRMSWSNCRDFWDTCDAKDVPETQDCLPSGPGLPRRWNGASSVRAIKRVWVTKRIVFNHLFLKLFKFSSLSFFPLHELSFVYGRRSYWLL